MTAITPDAQTIDTAHAIRGLEAARAGDVATHPDGTCALKMEDNGGRPWLLDPWRHGPPERVTTSALAQLGYLPAPTIVPSKPTVEPTQENVTAHLDMMFEAGWTALALAPLAGVSRQKLSRIYDGAKVSEVDAIAILSVGVDDPMPLPRITQAERIEDIEFMLDAGAHPIEVSARSGHESLTTTLKMTLRAGRKDLHDRLMRDPLTDTWGE